ncbi:MAG TPA: hypothetical protein VMH04_22820 [Candidatus Solibacter sp.]|nr:hypothetical protein [Candidatus Solibacter sp.]
MAATFLYALVGGRYEANLKVLVRRGRADAPASAQENAPLDVTRMAVTEEELNSEVELLRDEEVLRKVVEKNNLGGRDWFHFLRLNEGHAERVERATRRLAKKIRVEPVKKTNLINISYTSDDPQLSARVLQSMANAYIEKHTVVHRPSGEVRFFDQQRDESRRQLEEAKGSLLQFTARRGVISAAQQRDLTLQKLSDADASYRQARVDIMETQERVNDLQSLLAKLPERTTTQVRIADNPELQRALKANLLDLQEKRTQLLTKFEPSHRLVQEVDQQIAQAEAAIAKENSLPLRDETTDRNSHYEWAKAELQQAQIQLSSLQARAAATAGQKLAYQQMARQLGEDAITQDDLLSSEKAAEETYLLYVKKEEQARVDDALDQRGIVDVAIAQQPVAPALPLWSAWMIVAVGIVAAGASGTGAAFAADYFDSAFRSPEDVLACLNAPVLASLPKTKRGSLSA